jgi:hypothetical protein
MITRTLNNDCDTNSEPLKQILCMKKLCGCARSMTLSLSKVQYSKSPPGSVCLLVMSVLPDYIQKGSIAAHLVTASSDCPRQ